MSIFRTLRNRTLGKWVESIGDTAYVFGWAALVFTFAQIQMSYQTGGLLIGAGIAIWLVAFVIQDLRGE